MLNLVCDAEHRETQLVSLNALSCNLRTIKQGLINKKIVLLFTSLFVCFNIGENKKNKAKFPSEV